MLLMLLILFDGAAELFIALLSDSLMASTCRIQTAVSEALRCVFVLC